MMQGYPFNTEVLLVHQPLGTFYVAVLPVWLLLDTCYADKAMAIRTDDGSGYRIEGSQRLEKEARLPQIANYVNGSESAFPNSIIVAANFDPDGSPVEAGAKGDDRRWHVENDGVNGLQLHVPSNARLCPIIDGQHRLFSFTRANPARSTETDLVCSIFLDLPKPFQAHLFATINSTQKAVDRSLTYELFGYNVDTEPAEAWSPEKVAVVFARKLNTEQDSALFRHVLVAAENDFALTRTDARKQGTWVVSMATVVQGILRLFSSDPRNDASRLQLQSLSQRKRSSLQSDRSPLRRMYLETNDTVPYTMVKNFLSAVERVIWNNNGVDAFDKKTVGVQAIFDVLLHIASDAIDNKDISVEYFSKKIEAASNIDFGTLLLRNPSGVGRRLIRIAILYHCGLLKETLSNDDLDKIRSVLRTPPASQ